MAIEAELKARVHEPESVRALLVQRSDEESSTYSDAYFDTSSGDLTASDRELRVRVIETSGQSRTELTCKGPAVHAASRSKPEYETGVDDTEAVRDILTELGYAEVIAFTKHCRNYRFGVDGYDVLATLVTVPEVNGIFIEVETIVPDPEQMKAALDLLRDLLAELGIDPRDMTDEQYTDAVRKYRA